MKKTTITSLVSLVLSNQIYASTLDANQEIGVVNPVVVSATLYEQSLSDVLPSISVITREQIERSQALTVADIIKGEPGVEIGQNGGLGAMTSFFLRGQNSNSIAIFVDGIRVQPDGSGVLSSNTSLPPLQTIERIEILKGNSSALYGEAAIGGVINIFTKGDSNQPPKPFASITYGSHNTVDANAGLSGRVDNTKFSLTVNGTTSDGIPSINKKQYPAASSDTGGYKGYGVNASISQYINNDLEIGIKNRYQENTYTFNQTDPNTWAFINAKVDMKTMANDTTVFANYQINPNWLSRADFTYAKLNYTYSISRLDSPRTDTSTINWNNTYQISDSQKVAFGATYSSQDFNSGSNSAGNKMTRDSYGLYAGDSLKFGKIDVQLNGRYDHISVEQPDALSVNPGAPSTSKTYSKTTGLFGLGYHVTDNFRLTGTASTGFRAPSSSDIFPDASWGYSYNQNLRPETHRTYEFGGEYVNNWTNTRLVHFDTKTNNAIAWVFPIVTNIPTVKNDGWELSEKLAWNGYTLIGSYTNQDPKDMSTGKSLARRAKEFGSVDLNKSFGDWNIGTKILFSGTRSDVGDKTLSSYQIWSFYADYKATNEMTLRARLDNAFDENYQYAYGYNTLGRTGWLTLTYQ